MVVDFIGYWSVRTEMPVCRWLDWLGLCARTFSRWRQRYGKVNEHNGLIPRDHWLEP